MSGYTNSLGSNGGGDQLASIMTPSGAGGGGLDATDMAALAAIPPPDAEAKRKYEAMGLPDPVAFAALTAMGAVPDPMGTLNAMMLAAQERIEREEALSKDRQPPIPQLDLPQSKSFVEGFLDLQKAKEVQVGSGTSRGGYVVQRPHGLSRRAQQEADALELERQEARRVKHVQEVAKQARLATDRAKEAAETFTATLRDLSAAVLLDGGLSKDPSAKRGVAQAFATGLDDDVIEEAQLPPPRSLGTTLSSLLTGRQGAAAEAPLAAPANERLCISPLPPGTTESRVRLECARHGAIVSVILEASGNAAYVTFAAPDMAAAASRWLSRPGALGGVEPLNVRVVSEIPDKVRLGASLSMQASDEPTSLTDLPEYLRPHEDRDRKQRRSRSAGWRRRRERSRSARSPRKRSRSRRWLDRSRSNSHTATGQYIRATGCSSTVRWWEKRPTQASRNVGRSRSRSRKERCRSRSKSSRSASRGSSSRSRRRKPKSEDGLTAYRPRQVAACGVWAQYVLGGGPPYYYNVHTNQTTWERPDDFEATSASRRSMGMLL